MTTFIRSLSALLVVGALTIGCAPPSDQPPVDDLPPPPLELPPISAVAELIGADGTNHGMVTFTEEKSSFTVDAQLTGLSSGERGLHIHETGECSGPDFLSAGGHFNPTNSEHGGPTDDVRHAGDLGNVWVEEDGTVNQQMGSHLLSVRDEARSVVGRALVLDSGADDMVTQPAGRGGPRLACGVIRLEGDPGPGGEDGATSTPAADGP